MSGGHSHGGHSHGGHAHGGPTATDRYGRRLALVVAITLLVAAGEAVGAAVTGSVALIADAGHMLADAGGIGLALVAVRLGRRPATARLTFGRQRAEVLAALANGLILLVLAVGVVRAGILRLLAPAPDLDGRTMIVVAAVALVANAVGLWLLAPGRAESLNVRGAYLEVLGDLLGSVAAVAAGLGALAGVPAVDAVASIGIGLLIAPRALRLLRDVGHVLLEAAPAELDLTEVRRHLEDIPGVLGVHDLHAWTITSGVPVMSAHVEVSEPALADGGGVGVLRRSRECLHQHFDVVHSTLQVEPAHLRADEHAAHP